MRRDGLAGVSRRRVPARPRRTGPEAPLAPDLVRRVFAATAPNQLWVADITYVPTAAGFLYLAVVVDVFSRRVVGWALRASLHTTVVLEALEMAGPPLIPFGGSAAVQLGLPGLVLLGVLLRSRPLRWLLVGLLGVAIARLALSLAVVDEDVVH